jgi:short-subunit dehydrogenase
VKKLSEQTLVITGASSGIGRETALMAGKQGASVVLAARNEVSLRDVAQRIEAAGGKAHVVVTDVSDWNQVQRLAQEAANRFGAIDTWVNDASVSVYGTVEQMNIDEIERVIQVNLMGMIYGCKAVLPYMTAQQMGGTIINVGSVISERGVPLQSAYSAAKYGVRGFSEALRVELMRDHPDIKVTLIMPSSINTPFFVHARSKMAVKPKPLPPVYEPQLVAEAILFAAENPRREIMVGGMGKMFGFLEKLSPAMLDMYLVRDGFKQQQSDQPDDGQDNLFAPMLGYSSSRGEWGSQSSPVSPLTKLDFYPNLKRAVFAGALSAAFLVMRRVMRQA